MSLDRYCRTRIVVLHPNANVHEAARAMADNHIGSVLVAERRQLVGIVTDRDLALEIVGGDASHATAVRDVMSDELAVLPVAASLEDVVRAMREHRCRRVPLVDDDGKPIGLVTLDDLIADGAIDAAAARSVVGAQLEAVARAQAEATVPQGGPAPIRLAPRRARAAGRHKARAEGAHARLLRAVELHSGLTERRQAELALDLTLGMLCRRVTPDEARHLIAQLPSKLHSGLEGHLDGPDRRVNRPAIEAELRSRLGLGEDVAGLVLTSVCEALADCVTAGEIESLRGQLPLDMKDLFPPTPLRRYG